MGLTDIVCRSIKACMPDRASCSGDGDRMNRIVGGGVAVRVEKRRIRSVEWAAWREEGVRMRKGWGGGCCCCCCC